MAAASKPNQPPEPNPSIATPTQAVPRQRTTPQPTLADVAAFRQKLTIQPVSKSFKRRRLHDKLSSKGLKALELLAMWGLPDILVVQLIFEYVTKRTSTKRNDFQESAAVMAEDTDKFCKKLMLFYDLPDFRNYIEARRIVRRPATNGTDLLERVGAYDANEQVMLSIEDLPSEVLSFADLLAAASQPTRAYPRDVFQSRMLYLLFIALKHADPNASDYKTYGRIEALMRAADKSVKDYKTFKARIDRFRKARSEEATRADVVVERFGAFGIQQLFAISHKGFHKGFQGVHVVSDK